jgi:phosphoribosylamine--glycine ligase
MNILILGSGGREHALAWKLAQSKKVDRIYTGPGNAGTSGEGINLPINPENFEEVKRAVVDNNINMVVVGPEASLVAGIHDFFSNDRLLGGVPLIGPGRSAAQLEGSKAFAKDFMTRHKIPTAPYKSFERATIHEASEFLRSFDPPYVIKADGLAAGKGVLIYDNLSDAEKEVAAMMNGKFGTAGQKVVIEQFLEGIELSVFIITDGESYKMLPEAKDYKRIGVGDTGLNTGGMGAVSPVPFADAGFMQRVRQRIIDPTIKGLSDDGIVYKGFIFFGLMNVRGDPYVVEYNVRMGDPEAEATVPRIKSDLFELLEGVAEGNLSERTLEIDERFVSTVIIASGGYPEHYEKGKEILGLGQAGGCVIFHSGTKISDGKIVTSGGRVLAVSAWGRTMDEALSGSYNNAERISFENMYYRTDIGFDLH